MKKPIGLTGNMGSGKSTVARVLATLPRVSAIVFTDDIAKGALADPAHADAVRAIFGLAEHEEITPARIRDAFFMDSSKREKLETLIRTVVMNTIDAATSGAPQGSLVIVESALIYEKNFADRFDKVVVATCPYEVRVERLTKQRGMERTDIERRLTLQLPEAELVCRADCAIDTDCTLEELERRIRKLYETLLERRTP